MTMKRALLGVLALFAALIMLALVLLARFNPNQYAPELVAAVRQATGRELTLGSPVRVALSLTPTIEVDNVSLSNPAAFSSPALLTLQHLEAKIALLPLLEGRLVIMKLVLASPLISLQTNQAGLADWDFSPPAATGRSVFFRAGGLKTALESVDVQNATIIVQDAAGKIERSFIIADLQGKAASISAPLNLTAQASYNNIPISLSGVVGPVERFSGVGDGVWPVTLALQANGAAITIKGGVAHPRSARGYNFSLDASIPALEALLPGLPPVHGISAQAQLHDQGAIMPMVSGLFVKATRSDLSSWRAGLSLSGLDIEMASLNQPVTLKATGAMGDMPLSLTGNIGSMARLINPALLPATAQPSPGNFQISLQAQAGSGPQAANVAVTGGMATPATLAGVALGLSVNIPDLSALSALAGVALPDWKNIAAQTTLIDPGGLGLAQSAGLDGLSLTMDHAALGGDASFQPGPHPRLDVALKAQTLDVDALRAGFAAPTPARAPVPATAAAAPAMLVPNKPLPLATLNGFDGDFQLEADQLVFNKASYTALQAHAVLQNGVLTINPLTGTLPGGSVAAQARLNASTSPATASWKINAPALALQPVLNMLGLPGTAQGTLQFALNGSGSGDTWHEILASMNGELGVASVNGLVDGAAVKGLLGPVFKLAGLPPSPPGPVALRCFALRINVANGLANLSALTLDSSLLQIQGGGHLNFGDESLNLVMNPSLRANPEPAATAVELGGNFAQPRLQAATAADLAAATANAPGLQPTGLVQQAVNGTANALGSALGSALGLGSPPDICPASLALGRLGVPGPAAAALAAPAGTAGGAPGATPGTAPGATPGTTPAGPQNLLNSLLNN